MTLTPRSQAFLAVLSIALSAALSLPFPAAAGTASAEAARAIGHEQSALDSSAARLTALTEAMRPRARADELDVASGEVARTRELAAAPARLDFRTLDALPRTTGDAEWQCLAQAIYFESRGEPLDGQVAVAEVVLNRVGDRHFPGTVCGVTRQGAGSGRGCQFSYVCDGNSDAMKSAVARSRAEKLATLMLGGRARTLTDGATHFHTRSVRPGWSHRMTRTASIGHHYFYRSGTQVAAAD
jgi:spore germination cell wall hydrolase CwlJ-like protein